MPEWEALTAVGENDRPQLGLSNVGWIHRTQLERSGFQRRHARPPQVNFAIWLRLIARLKVAISVLSVFDCRQHQQVLCVARD